MGDPDRLSTGGGPELHTAMMRSVLFCLLLTASLGSELSAQSLGNLRQALRSGRNPHQLPDGMHPLRSVDLASARLNMAANHSLAGYLAAAAWYAETSTVRNLPAGIVRRLQGL